MGYRPRALPLSDANGDPIALAAHHDAAMVDRHCRIVGADGAPVPGAFGIGLAAGFVPWGPMGGEKSRSEEHTSELQSLMRISYAVFCLKKKSEHTVLKYTKVTITLKQEMIVCSS